MTYLYASWAPLMCNNLFEALFTVDKAPLKKEFNSGKFDKKAILPLYQNYNITVNNTGRMENATAYFVHSD